MARCGPPPKRPARSSSFHCGRCSAARRSRRPASANGARLSTTISIRPSVATAGVTSLRTARPTIQLPTQRTMVARSARWAAKRIGCDYVSACYAGPMPQLTAAGRRLEYQWVGDPAPGKRALVFLHEGLGSIRQWRDFPAKLSEAAGLPALVYDRYGYGQSDALQEPRRTVRFMHEEALSSLPEVLKALEIAEPILVGHSDGAS